MGKLAQYMQVLTDDSTAYDRHRADGNVAMREFGLSAREQEVLVRGTPDAIRAEIHEKNPTAPIKDVPPEPKPPSPTK